LSGWPRCKAARIVAIGFGGAGHDRSQTLLLPGTVDDYVDPVSAHHPKAAVKWGIMPNVADFDDFMSEPL
jgi:hypothetical protein